MTEGRKEDARLARLGRAAGLCADCRHRRLLESARSVFVRCSLAAEDPSLPRYPPLPVLACHGYAAPDPDGAA